MYVNIPYVGLADTIREIKIGQQDAGGTQQATSYNEHHHEWLRGFD